jgi:hypothetical protein
MQKYKPLAYLAILAVLAGLVLSGWLIGHVLRYSLPALWGTPLPEMEPGIMTGFEYEGVRRLAQLTQVTRIQLPNSGEILRRPSDTLPGNASQECVSDTFFTSLPAKCRSADGRLVRVGGSDSVLILIPPE